MPQRTLNLSMAFSSTIFNRPLFTTLLRAFSSHSSPPPPSSPNLISAAVSILKYQRSRTRWSHLRSLLSNSVPALTPSQFSEITLQLRNDPHLALRFFSFTVQHSLCPHSLFSYATIIHILSRSRMKREAKTLIRTTVRKFTGPNSLSPPPIFETLVKTYRVCDSAPFVFDLLIKACIECKRIHQAIKIVRMLKSRNVWPRISTCNALIELALKSLGCVASYDLYKEIFLLENGGNDDKGLRGVDVKSETFNVIMLGFYREGLVERVEEVWGEMLRKNCVPNEYSYSILIASYCENERIEDAVRIWEEMRDKGIKSDVVGYNTIIGGFCRIGEVCRAEEIFREMVLTGVESTCMTFEHLVNGYCKVGVVDSAIVLYNDMCRKGFKPDSSTVDAIIELLYRNSNVSEGLEILRTAIKKYNMFPKRRSYVFLIKGLCQVGNIEEATRLQAEMVGKGYEPDEEIYSAFIDGHMKQGNEEMAQKLRMEMLRTQIPLEEN